MYCIRVRLIRFAILVLLFSIEIFAFLPATLDYCRNGFPVKECEEPEPCAQLSNNGGVVSCGTRTEPCFCLEYIYDSCKSSSACTNRGACVKFLPQATMSYCVSCKAIFRRSPQPIFIDSGHNCFTPSPLPTPIPVPVIKDDTFKKCHGPDNCKHSCTHLKSDGSLDNCSGIKPCFCFGNVSSYGNFYNTCDESLDCAIGEVCAYLKKNTLVAYCVSCEAVERRFPKPSLVDSQHFCGKNVPVLPKPDDTFKYCKNGVLYNSCTRICSTVMNDGSIDYCGTTSQPCFCTPYFGECTESSSCREGEACVKMVPLAAKSYCVLCDTIFRRSPRPIFIDKNHSCLSATPSVTPYPSPSVYYDTFKPCSTDKDCLYECNEEGDGFPRPCNGSKDCFCWPDFPDNCDQSKDCAVGEGCLKLKKTSLYSFCIPCDAAKRRYKKPDFVDIHHYCNGNIPILPASKDIFRYCRNGVLYSCDVYGSECSEIKNGGTLGPCDTRIGPCFCFAPGYRYSKKCKSSLKCLENEACVKLETRSSKSFCVPCDAIARRSPKPIFVDRIHSCKSPPPLVTPYPIPTNIVDDTLKKCSNYEDCTDDCFEIEKDGTIGHCHSSKCFCAPEFSCTTSRDCGIGQACVYLTSKVIEGKCLTCKGISKLILKPTFVDNLHIC